MAKSKFVGLWLTVEDLATIDRAAAAANMTRSAYIRGRILVAPAVDAGKVRDMGRMVVALCEDLVREVRRLGR